VGRADHEEAVAIAQGELVAAAGPDHQAVVVLAGDAQVAQLLGTRPPAAGTSGRPRHRPDEEADQAGDDRAQRERAPPGRGPGHRRTRVDRLPRLAGVAEVGQEPPEDAGCLADRIAGPAARHQQRGEVADGEGDQRDRDDG
jgi:hypothetical protein